jgi:hypothetical protein
MRRSRFRTGSQLNTQPSRLAGKECAESERTANPVQTTAISGCKRGLVGTLLTRETPEKLERFQGEGQIYRIGKIVSGA